MKFKHLINNITIDIWFSGNFAINCYLMVNLSKFTSDGKILSRVVTIGQALSILFYFVPPYLGYIYLFKRFLKISHLNFDVSVNIILEFSVWTSLWKLYRSNTLKLKYKDGISFECNWPISFRVWEWFIYAKIQLMAFVGNLEFSSPKCLVTVDFNFQ